MGPTPRVSIVIPFLNPGRFLAEAIESVLAQTYQDWELHLVNDGSRDESESIAEAFAADQPHRIHCHHHPGCANRGTAASRNLAARLARGAMLAFLDADDVWLPEKLQQQVDLLDGFPAADVLYGATLYWHSWTGNPSDRDKDELPSLGLEPNVVYQPPSLAIVNYPLGVGTAPSMNTVMIRREAFERIGGFVDSFTGIHRMYEDQAFLIKVYLWCTVVTSGHCWDRYRQHSHSICAQVTDTGLYETVRAHFLRWCREYLDEKGITDSRVRAALEGAIGRMPVT